MMAALIQALLGSQNTSVGIDPQLSQFLQSITGGGMSRMAAQYQNLGLGPDASKGVSPQEATDLAWTGQQGDLTGTTLAQQETPTLLAANQLNLSQLANTANQAGQLGSAAGSAAGLGTALG